MEERVEYRNPVKRLGWSPVYHVIVYDKRVSSGAKNLYGAYLSHALGKNIAWPGRERMANLLDTSVATISRWNTELEEAGYITRVRRLGTSSITYIEDCENNPYLVSLAKEIWGVRNKKNKPDEDNGDQMSQNCDVDDTRDDTQNLKQVNEQQVKTLTQATPAFESSRGSYPTRDNWKLLADKLESVEEPDRLDSEDDNPEYADVDENGDETQVSIKKTLKVNSDIVKRAMDACGRKGRYYRNTNEMRDWKRILSKTPPEYITGWISWAERTNADTIRITFEKLTALVASGDKFDEWKARQSARRASGEGRLTESDQARIINDPNTYAV